MECHRRGIRVPDDLAITGFGDIEMAREVVPALTTVDTLRRNLGKLCADVLAQRIGGKYTGPAMIDSGFQIIRRESA
jgi:LacI family gluconate utilization system Gnt-I transcriptional repressor